MCTNFVPRNVPVYLTPKHVKDCQRTADHKIVSAQIIKSLLRDRYFEIGTLQDSPRMISTGKSLDLKPVFFIGDEGNRSPRSSKQFL